MANKQFNSVDGYSVGNASIVIDANGNISGNLIVATANVTAPRFISNVATGTAPFVVTSTTQVANLNVATAGTVTTNAQPNITSVGTLTALNVSGNISLTGANVSLGSVSNLKITGGTNGYVLSTDGTGNLSWIAGGGTSGTAYVYTQSTPATTWTINHNLGVQYVNIQVIDSTGNSFTGRYNYPTITFNNTTHCTVTFDSAQAGYAAVTSGGGEVGPPGPAGSLGGANTEIQFNDAGVANASSAFTFNKTTNTVSIGNALSVTGNVTAGNIVGTFANGNSSITIPAANGNIVFGSAGNANILVITGTGANILGTISATNANIFGNLNVTSNANVGNLGTARVIATGNISGTQLISNIATGTAPLVVTSTTQVANLNAATAGTAGSATTAGTVTTNAQPNITSVGTLTSLTVSGTSNLGAVGNITITGGSTGQLLTTNGAGGLSWTTVTGGGGGASISNGTSNVNIATSGGNITMGVGGTANVVTVTTSNVQLGTGSGGNISGANIITANMFVSSVSTGVSAAGTVQSNATALTSQISVVSTVPSGTGVRLPTAIAGMRITVINTSANVLLVYPATSGIINSQATNAAYSQPAGAKLDYVSTSATQWYTLNAT